MLTILPLANYLRQQSADWRIRWGTVGVIMLTVLSVVSSQSRGAFLGLMAAGLFLWTKTTNKIVSAMATIVLLAGILAFMPQTWYDRMNTIKTYSAENTDTSDNRLFLWETGWRLALARPLNGVGFYGTYNPQIVSKYNPGAAARSLHSIYFETLAEHGFPTFFVWLAFPIVMWLSARHIVRVADDTPDLQWAIDLAKMSQVSIVAFLVSGAFLPLMYYDVYFTIMAVVTATRVLVDKELAGEQMETTVMPWRRQAAFTRQRPGLAGGIASRFMNG